MFGEAGGGRLHAGELIGRLRAVAEGQFGGGIKVAGLLHHLHQVGDGNLAEHVAGALGEAHVAFDQCRVGPADLGEDFAGDEVNDLVGLEALVRFAPTEHGDVKHGWVPFLGGIRSGSE